MSFQVTYDTFYVHITPHEFLMKFLLTFVVLDVFGRGPGLPDTNLVVFLEIVLQLFQSFNLKPVRLHSFRHNFGFFFWVCFQFSSKIHQPSTKIERKKKRPNVMHSPHQTPDIHQTTHPRLINN